MEYATRMSRLGTETAFVVLARAQALERQGREIVHLEIGEPDFDTPRNIRQAAAQALDEGWTHYGPAAGLLEFRQTIAENIRQAAAQALDEGWTHYGPAAGLLEFRQTIAEYVGRTRGIEVTPDEVVVTPGAKPIMFYTMLALLNEGDEAMYPNPGFPIYESVIEFLGAKPVPLRLREENEFAFDLDEFERLVTPRTRFLILNSPQNPTGGVLNKKALDRIAEVARRHDFYILSDEIYSRILFDEKPLSLASYPALRDRVIVLDGFSKTYAMTGWRLGYGVMEAKLAKAVAQLQTNCASCTNSFVQRAGIAALRGPQDEVDKMVAEFRRRRDRIVAGLNQLPGVTCRMPRGAFYVFPNITGTGMKSMELANALLDEAGVALLSGTAFGAYGEGYLRLSCANSLPNIEKALQRMNEFLSARVRV